MVCEFAVGHVVALGVFGTAGFPCVLGVRRPCQGRMEGKSRVLY